MEPLPTLDSLIEGNPNEPQQGKEAVKEVSTTEGKDDNIERIERERKFLKEKWKQDQRIKELEKQLADNSDKASKVDLNSKNPFKDIVKAKNLTQDQVIELALEAMDGDLTLNEKKEEMKSMSPEEIAELVKKQLKEEQALEEKKGVESKAITDFKQKISKVAEETADKYPLVYGLGGHEAAYNLIEQQFLADSKEYGEDYARENLMDIGEAIKKTQETLALSVKSALKSKHLQEYLLKAIKEEGGEANKQSQERSPLKESDVTLTNRDFRGGTEPHQKPQFKGDQDELDYLINKFI